MNAKLKTASPQTTVTRRDESNSQIQEQIQRRAYELYERHGKENGHALRDWLQAESEMTADRETKTVAA